MKKMLMLFALAVVCFQAQAQFKTGIKGGLSSAFYSSSKITSGSQVYEMAAEGTPGFHVGLFGRVSLPGIYVQPELLYTQTRAGIKVKDLNGNETGSGKQQFHTLDVPVMVGLKFLMFRAGLGPVASFMLSESSNVAGYAPDFNKASLGYQVGVGVDVWKLTLDARYQGNLGKLGDEVTVEGQTFNTNTRSQQFIVSLGIIF